VLLGLLATSLTQRDRSIPKVDEATGLQRVVTEAIRLSASGSRSPRSLTLYGPRRVAVRPRLAACPYGPVIA